MSEFCRATAFDCCTETIEFRLHSKERRQTTITPKEICKHDNSFKYKSTHWRNFANNNGKKGGGRRIKSTMCVRNSHTSIQRPIQCRGFIFFLSLHHPINSFENVSTSCFFPLQLSTQIKLFLGAFASLASPPPS